MNYQIFDKKGRTYTLSITESDRMLLAKLYDRHVLVGEAKCVRESPNTLFLADIAIANSVTLVSNNPYIALLRKIPGYQPKPINYRSKGLGSALLKHLIDYARDKGVQQLHGKVYRQDIQNNQKLLHWYQQHGFNIRSSNSNDKQDVVALIHLDI